jgi:hypothetical protein
MTIGELKAALEGVPDDVEVIVDVATDNPPHKWSTCAADYTNNDKMTIWADIALDA